MVGDPIVIVVEDPPLELWTDDIPWADDMALFTAAV
jgi:hypothetical protein